MNINILSSPNILSLSPLCFSIAPSLQFIEFIEINGIFDIFNIFMNESQRLTE